MLFEFKSRATGTVVMTGDVGKKVLPLIGKSPDPKGIITVSQMPAAIAALEAACKREQVLAAAAKEKARNPRAERKAEDASEEDSGDDPHLVGICQRVFPLIEMLKAAQAGGKDITWVSEPLFEPIARPLAGWRTFSADVGPLYAANGLIAFIFAATGPVAVVLSIGLAGGLSESQLASWLFGAFFLNGLLTIAFCLMYRRPLVFFWTIPGTVLLGPALTHLSFPEVVGAFVATGLLMLVLGLLGWVRRLMSAIPVAIVMGMVAGVFLRFGTDLVFAVRDAWLIALPMIVVFLALSASPLASRRLPPLIGALLAGAALVALGAGADGPGAPATQASAAADGAAALAASGRWFAAPLLQLPVFSLQAMIELVVPLAITVLIVQNGQGVAVLSSAGHATPVTAVTVACGALSIVTGFVGTVSTCLTGPANALAASSGERSRHYTAGVVTGLLALAFGLLAPAFTRLVLSTPAAFIATLAGLALLRVLQASFVIAFGGRFSLGALAALIVTIAGVTVAGIGAPFWGLVVGFSVSALLEKQDFQTA